MILIFRAYTEVFIVVGQELLSHILVLYNPVKNGMGSHPAL
jgi:hypothetical protein